MGGGWFWGYAPERTKLELAPQRCCLSPGVSTGSIRGVGGSQSGRGGGGGGCGGDCCARDPHFGRLRTRRAARSEAPTQLPAFAHPLRPPLLFLLSSHLPLSPHRYHPLNHPPPPTHPPTHSLKSSSGCMRSSYVPRHGAKWTHLGMSDLSPDKGCFAPPSPHLRFNALHSIQHSIKVHNSSL